MPYKDYEKQKEANRKSYRKYSIERNRKIIEWQKNNPEKRLKHVRESGWKRAGIKNADGSRFLIKNYNEWFTLQNGNCAIDQCKKKPSDFKKIFDVDHDHKTGIVRGLLCGEHNKTLGKVHDSISELQALIRYLVSHSQEKLRICEEFSK